MNKEEEIINKIKEKFPTLASSIRLQRTRRLWVEAPYEIFEQFLNYAVGELSFTTLCTITGLDEGEKLSAICHLANQEGVVLNLKTSIPKNNPVWKSISNVFPGGAIYERELVDLLGFKVEGLPPGSRYPLPDGWPEGEYPLRKDWQHNEETKGAKTNG
jgi:Ni,Fe-hydrogenase III component G